MGTFVAAERRGAGVPIEGRYRPGEREPAVLAAGRAWPRQRTVWLYPGLVAAAASLGVVGILGYGTALVVRRG